VHGVGRTHALVDRFIPNKVRKTVTFNIAFLGAYRKRHQVTVELTLSLVQVPTPVISAVTLIYVFSSVQSIRNGSTVYDAFLQDKIKDIAYPAFTLAPFYYPSRVLLLEAC